MRYRRADAAGGTYFFTVNLADRQSDLLVRQWNDLREVIFEVRQAHPFSIIAMVVLPDHLHAIWRLPEEDADFPLRWSLIKSGFSRRQAAGERIRPSRKAKRERGIWQPRYWEHQIRDDADLERHVDSIHFNPVKHNSVAHAADWLYSTLRRDIERGRVGPDWGGERGGKEEEEGYGER
jgi:putative transposase